ncbi:MAG: Holliday junction resolvase RuvX [Anaerolineales bacterium]|nr:Holliday junction resolvase RuvX [Anaerolineales bacterium]
MRILAVDPGEVRIGLAISDATGTIATPLTIILHESRDKDLERIAAAVKEHGAEMIVVGYALNEHGRPTHSGRRAEQMARALRGVTDLEVELVEESFSTRDVLTARLASGMKRKKRRTPPDAEAAALILQGYLDSKQN